MFRRLSLIVASLFAATTAHAQFVSVYGTFSPLHLSNVGTGVTGSAYTQQFDSYWTPAFGGGVTLNMLNLHVVKLGLDVRGSTKPGTKGADTAELSVRLGFQPPLLKLKPYGQLGVGYLATRTFNVSSDAVGATVRNEYATLGGHVGVDAPLVPFLDFRILELGYAHAYSTGISFTNVNESANLFTVSTGLVAHF